MAFGCVGSRRVRIRALVGLIGIVAVALSVVASPAEAARKKKRPAGGGYAPPYAAMVVDAKSGRTLHAVNEDAPRIPASITKVMTLYLLFEQLERGRFTMGSEFTVSSYAARQAPSKIGFQPGETIEVRDAIMALITKSANDVAVAVAENVAGSEDEFARMMTARARSLGMRSTAFYNPHGLPHNPPNITTARDLTILPGPSRSVSRNTTRCSRRAAPASPAATTATTTSCSAASRAWTASRPATPASRAST